MNKCIDYIQPCGDVLEIGFGLGYSARKLCSYPIKSYTVIECEPVVWEKIDLFKQEYPTITINVIKGRWENKLKRYKDIELRLIGPLQTNKVKQALKLFNVIETLDREKLAKEIANNINDETKTQSFYIQINTGDEGQKGGIGALEADDFINYCKNDLALPISGLMCIPPEIDEPAMHFSLLKKIAYKNNLQKLSMGMSNDFEEAIKFGATSVRIGSMFFGERQN